MHPMILTLRRVARRLPVTGAGGGGARLRCLSSDRPCLVAFGRGLAQAAAELQSEAEALAEASWAAAWAVLWVMAAARGQQLEVVAAAPRPGMRPTAVYPD